MQLVYAGVGADPAIWSPPRPPSLGASSVMLRLLANPVHLALIAVTLSALAGTGEWLLLLAVPLVDLLFLRVFAASSSIRRMVAECEQLTVDRERDRRRLLVSSAMGETHRRELERLQAMVGSLYQRLPELPGGDALLEELGFDRLLATYASLAVAHREGRAMLELVPPPARSDAGGGDTQKRRDEAANAARERLDRIARQLQTIADLIVAAHAQSVAPTGLVDEARREIDEAVSALEAIESATTRPEGAIPARPRPAAPSGPTGRTNRGPGSSRAIARSARRR